MTVLVIIGLMSSAVVLTMPRTKPVEEAVSRALLSKFNIAAQDSLITGRSVAFGLSQDGYGFYIFENDNWTSMQETNFPAGIDITLTKDDNAIDLTDEITPLIVFEPTGLSTFFQLELAGTERSMCLSSKGDGRVSLMDKACPA